MGGDWGGEKGQRQGEGGEDKSGTERRNEGRTRRTT